MKQGVGALIRQAGLQLMQLVMERDVEQMLGPRYQQTESRPGWPFMVLVTMGLCVGGSSPRLYALRLRHLALGVSDPVWVVFGVGAIGVIVQRLAAQGGRKVCKNCEKTCRLSPEDASGSEYLQ
jgi:hypothetical protein